MAAGGDPSEVAIDPALIAAVGPPAHAPQNGAAKGRADNGRRVPARRGRPPAAHAAAPAAQTMGAAAPGAAPTPGFAPPTGPNATLVPEEQTRDAMIVWPMVVQQQYELGVGVAMLGIMVKRQPAAAATADNSGIQLASIDGELVSGSETESPGEALYNYLAQSHVTTATGPSLYKLRVYRKQGGHPIHGGACELKLGHPGEVRAQLENRSAQQNARARWGPPAPAMRPAFPMTGAPTYPAAPPQSAQPGDADTVAWLRTTLGKILDERGFAAPQAPAAQGPAPRDPRHPPEGLTEAEWETIQLTRQAKALGPTIATSVAQTLQGMGFTPELLASLRVAATPPPAPSASLAAPTAPVTPQTPVQMLKEAIGMISALKEVMGEAVEEGAMTAAAAPDPDPAEMKPIAGGTIKHPGTDAPILFGPKLEGENWAAYFARYLMQNPASMERVMTYVQKTFDPKTLQTIVDAITRRGGRGGGGGAPPTAPAAAAIGPRTEVVEEPPVGWSPTG